MSYDPVRQAPNSRPESSAPAASPAAAPAEAAAAVGDPRSIAGGPSTPRPRAEKPLPSPAPMLASPAGKRVVHEYPLSDAAKEIEDPELMKRRQFLMLGWGGVATFLGALSIGSARYFFPRILFEPPTIFKAGFPQEYTIGEVNTNYQQSGRVWIVREPEGFYALLAKCTHLGCTPVWWPGENKFKCPCHGSGFTKEGINYEGPAPRPLERVRISLADDGQLLIDTGKVYRQEMAQWEQDGAFLRLS